VTYEGEVTMALPKHREVRPSAAERPDGKWIPNARVYYEIEGGIREEPVDWPDHRFDTQEEALDYAKQAGEAWLNKRLGVQR
jgi:hypothetical protein